jgi:hypothetical protein
MHMVKRIAMAAVLVASVAGPARALNPQPLPPVATKGSLTTGEHYEITQSHLIIGTGSGRHRAKAGSYRLSTGQTLTVDSTGKFTSATLGHFPSLSNAELNPQPLPP